MLGGDQFVSHVPMVRLGGITLLFACENDIKMGNLYHCQSIVRFT